MSTSPHRALITRSKEGNKTLAAGLERVGLEAVAVDTFSLSPPEDWTEVDDALRNLSSFDWIVLTSPSGAKFFLQRIEHLGIHLSNERPLVAAVGPSTALELSRNQILVSFTPSNFLTRALGAELPENHGSNVLLLRTDIADESLSETLVQRGFRVEERRVYRTVSNVRNFREVPDVELVVFASPSAVHGLCGMLSKQELHKLRAKTAYCIGPVTARAAKDNGFETVIVAKTHTIEALVSEIARRGTVDN